MKFHTRLRDLSLYVKTAFLIQKDTIATKSAIGVRQGMNLLMGVAKNFGLPFF